VDDEVTMGFSALTVTEALVCSVGDMELVSGYVEALPVSVQPAQKIPTMRIAETLSMNSVLFFMSYISPDLS